MQLLTSNTDSARHISALQWLKGIICIGAVVVIVERLWIMSRVPLWLDETWSAMIATQTDWHSFWHEAWLDCNPPLYYLTLKIWVFLFGNSDVALRLPSLIFTTSAALSAIKWGPKSLGDLGKWTWAALIIFWMHSLTLSIDARGYGLLILLSVLNSIIFYRLYESFSSRATMLWVFVCSLMFLTHYFSATIIAAQLALLLYRHKLDMLRAWPAALIGLPPLAWFAYQLPRLTEYARPDVAWYDPLNFGSAISYIAYAFGPPLPTFLPLVLLVVCAGLVLDQGATHLGDDRSSLPASSAGAWATALAGIFGLAIAFTLGAFRASLTDRYLVPIVPSMLLGLTLIALKSKRRELICVLLTSFYLFSSINFVVLEEFSENRNDYGYEKGSAFLAGYRPTHLVFAWDHPASKILETSSLAKLGSFFLRRKGLNFKTTALVLNEHDDPNLALSKAADGARPAIIWLYNTARRSAARHYPPMFDNDPNWSCRHYTQPYMSGELGEIACIKKSAANV